MSDASESSMEGCGRLLGFAAACSLVGGVYGQVLRWTGAIECDWTVVWGPAAVIWTGVVLLFAAAGAILATQEKT